jgi:RNA polymerase sigma factor (sigma-70 family)
MNDATFQALLIRLRKGDRQACTELFKAFAPPLHVTIVGMWGNDLAQDAVQEAFLALWRNPNALNSSTSVKTFPGWLYMVAWRYARDAWERAKPFVPFPEGTELPAAESVPSWETAEEVARVWKALDQLQPKEQVVIRLRHGEGMSLAHIARKLNIPVGTIQARFFRGLSRLRAELAVVEELQPGEPGSGSHDVNPAETVEPPADSPETADPRTEVEQ